MHIIYRLGYGGVLAPSIPYYCKSIGVDNPGWQWVHIPSENVWVAPFTRGSVIPLSVPTATPYIDTVPPSGALLQPDSSGTTGPIKPVYSGLASYTQIGELAYVRFIREALPPVAGIPIDITSQYTAQVSFNANGIPATDPYTITGPTVYQQLFGSFLAGFFLDLLNVTLSFQSANISPGVETIQAQFDNAPVLAIPPNGILQQSFAPGMARVTVKSFPNQLPALKIQSAGGGAIALTAYTQSVLAQATYRLAIS